VTQLSELAKQFTGKYVKTKPGGFAASYVEHGDITQRLLQVVGPFDFRVIELIRNPQGEVEGALASLTAEVDGRSVTVVEVGDVENPGSKNNGARAKDAASDAIKRCAMRLGLGLHLWCADHYFLDKVLEGSPVVAEADREAAVPATGDTQGAGR
jgi:hypothetical protein